MLILREGLKNVLKFSILLNFGGRVKPNSKYEFFYTLKLHKNHNNASKPTLNKSLKNHIRPVWTVERTTKLVSTASSKVGVIIIIVIILTIVIILIIVIIIIVIIIIVIILTIVIIPTIVIILFIIIIIL